jgi:hypothetical protein
VGSLTGPLTHLSFFSFIFTLEKKKYQEKKKCPRSFFSFEKQICLITPNVILLLNHAIFSSYLLVNLNANILS